MAKREELIVGLDIGTTKIAAIVGEVTEDGIDVVGLGTAPSRGLRKGVVTNIDATVQSIRRAIEEAEHMAGCEITSVYAGIAGGHIKGLNSHGIVAVKDKEVRAVDIARVIEAAKAVAIPADREIIHVLPQEYVIDEQDGIREPIGMSGVRLEAKVHIVTAAATSVQNIVKCCNRCDLQVADVVLQPLASGEAVLEGDEKDLGVVVIDIGGGTTDLVIFSDGSVVHTSVIPVGGNQLTNDIAVGLRTPLHEAERIKQRWGCAMSSMVKDGETIEVPSVGGRQPRVLPRRVLCEIIEPRVDEIYELIANEIKKTGFEEMLASGAVITGGTSILEGMPELGEEVLGLPMRRALPRGVGGLVDVVKSPVFATGIGLLLFGARHQHNPVEPKRGGFRRVFGRVADWFREVR